MAVIDTVAFAVLEREGTFTLDEACAWAPSLERSSVRGALERLVARGALVKVARSYRRGSGASRELEWRRGLAADDDARSAELAVGLVRALVPDRSGLRAALADLDGIADRVGADASSDIRERVRRIRSALEAVLGVP